MTTPSSLMTLQRRVFAMKGEMPYFSTLGGMHIKGTISSWKNSFLPLTFGFGLPTKGVA